MSDPVAAVETQDGRRPRFAGPLNWSKGECQGKCKDGAVGRPETDKDSFDGLELIRRGTYRTNENYAGRDEGREQRDRGAAHARRHAGGGQRQSKVPFDKTKEKNVDGTSGDAIQRSHSHLWEFSPDPTLACTPLALVPTSNENGRRSLSERQPPR